ncbi:amino acid ABC transporter permease [Haloplasma contractile]|uniref:Amino acid ABC transporter permease protein n=1 Tax=Haloplasma contractile SSD-17B TaxID=1033810 RepID=F7Q0K5_9MOLU|nr:amino acid ABC transporter permease [Haloplasma contractile]ERJ12650.1 putative amino acid ABC transporter permease protein [Haloplasma contractile SSD-17B]
MDFSFLNEYYPFFIDGAKYTLLLAIFTVLFGVLLGTVIALMRISNSKFLSLISTSYVEFIRGTPILVQLYIIYYGLPKIGLDFGNLPVIGDTYGDFIAGIITLSINSAAYVSEIIRAGIKAVDRGQMEAARSLGLSSRTSMRFIIFPQAIKNILPALGNEFIIIIKESSIVSIIGIQELMYKADTVRGNTFQPFEPLIVAAILYFIMTFTLSKFLGVAERRLSLHDQNN